MAAEAAAKSQQGYGRDETQNEALTRLPMASVHGTVQNEQQQAEDCIGKEAEHEDGAAPCDDARYMALFEYQAEELAQLEVLTLAGCEPALTDWDVEDGLEILEQANLLAELDLSNNTSQTVPTAFVVRFCSLVCFDIRVPGRTG